MKIVQQARLRYTEGNSDKVYEVDLIDVFTVKGRQYAVNFRYGRFGSKLREGTKTPEPVDQISAQKIFDSLVVSKLNKGYYDTLAQAKASITAQRQTKDNSPSSRERQILHYLDQVPSHWSLSRIIWRAGELRLKGCADKIVQHLQSKANIQNYSVIWALGRTGNHEHLPIIEPYLFESKFNIEHIAFEAGLNLMLPRKRDEVLQNQFEEFSVSIKQAIKTQDCKALINCFSGELSNHPDELETLQKLYTQARSHPVCHQATMQLISTLDARHYPFRLIFRRLYKIAEFRDDYEILAALVHHLSILSSKKADTQLSYTGKNYFQRRSWRILRHLGEADDSRFVDFAEQLLLRFSDDDPKHREVDNYSAQYKSFSGCLAFNHLLYRSSKAYTPNDSATAFIDTGISDSNNRTEAFPELWDRAPQKLLNLLLQSRYDEVQHFATKALSDNSEFCLKLSAQTLIELLNSRYQNTSAFALAILIERFDSNNPDLEILKACIGCNNSAAHQQLMNWVDENPSLLTTNPDFLAILLTVKNPQIIIWANDLLAQSTMTSKVKMQVIEALCQYVASLPLDADFSHVNERISNLTEQFAQAVEKLQITNLKQLIEHPNVDIQYFAGKLLLLNQATALDIPETWFDHFNQSSHANLQGLGVALLIKFDDRYLLNKQALLIAYCHSDISEIRQQIGKIIERLTLSSATFAQSVFLALIDLLFKSESSQGVHDDIVALMNKALRPLLEKMDKNLCWRLLHAQSKGAQKLGATTLSYLQPELFSIKQWAILGKHSDSRARRFAMKAFDSNVAQIKANPVEALEIIHTQWDDAQNFAFEYFKQHFGAEHWTPQLLIGICDNTNEAVQSFGRELIVKFFDQGHGAEYLIKLSQHPSHQVQLFATNFLSEFANDNLERLNLLRSYFVTVLSKVYRGRLSKDKVMNFLAEQGRLNIESAKLVMEILERQSLTLSLTDRAACISVMHQLHNHYPQLDTPMYHKPLKVKGSKTKESDFAG